jgi:hypothetical protein
MTDGDGDFSRLRVDVGQTGFFAGREARTFYEFTIASGATQVIKVVAPVNTIVQMFSVELELAHTKNLDRILSHSFVKECHGKTVQNGTLTTSFH